MGPGYHITQEVGQREVIPPIQASIGTYDGDREPEPRAATSSAIERVQDGCAPCAPNGRYIPNCRLVVRNDRIRLQCTFRERKNIRELRPSRLNHVPRNASIA